MANSNLATTFSTPLLKNADGSTMISVGQVATAAVGALALYMFVPSHKRKRLFK